MLCNGLAQNVLGGAGEGVKNFTNYMDDSSPDSGSRGEDKPKTRQRVKRIRAPGMLFLITKNELYLIIDARNPPF